jgi:hypothetical protein
LREGFWKDTTKRLRESRVEAGVVRDAEFGSILVTVSSAAKDDKSILVIVRKSVDWP